MAINNLAAALDALRDHIRPAEEEAEHFLHQSSVWTRSMHARAAALKAAGNLAHFSYAHLPEFLGSHRTKRARPLGSIASIPEKGSTAGKSFSSDASARVVKCANPAPMKYVDAVDSEGVAGQAKEVPLRPVTSATNESSALGTELVSDSSECQPVECLVQSGKELAALDGASRDQAANASPLALRGESQAISPAGEGARQGARQASLNELIDGGVEMVPEQAMPDQDQVSPTQPDRMQTMHVASRLGVRDSERWEQLAERVMTDEKNQTFRLETEGDVLKPGSETTAFDDGPSQNLVPTPVHPEGKMHGTTLAPDEADITAALEAQLKADQTVPLLGSSRMQGGKNQNGRGRPESSPPGIKEKEALLQRSGNAARILQGRLVKCTGGKDNRERGQRKIACKKVLDAGEAKEVVQTDVPAGERLSEVDCEGLLNNVGDAGQAYTSFSTPPTSPRQQSGNLHCGVEADDSHRGETKGDQPSRDGIKGDHMRSLQQVVQVASNPSSPSCASFAVWMTSDDGQEVTAACEKREESLDTKDVGQSEGVNMGGNKGLGPLAKKEDVVKDPDTQPALNSMAEKTEVMSRQCERGKHDSDLGCENGLGSSTGLFSATEEVPETPPSKASGGQFGKPQMWVGRMGEGKKRTRFQKAAKNEREYGKKVKRVRKGELPLLSEQEQGSERAPLIRVTEEFEEKDQGLKPRGTRQSQEAAEVLPEKEDAMVFGRKSLGLNQASPCAEEGQWEEEVKNNNMWSPSSGRVRDQYEIDAEAGMADKGARAQVDSVSSPERGDREPGANRWGRSTPRSEVSTKTPPKSALSHERSPVSKSLDGSTPSPTGSTVAVAVAAVLGYFRSLSGKKPAEKLATGQVSPMRRQEDLRLDNGLGTGHERSRQQEQIAAEEGYPVMDNGSVRAKQSGAVGGSNGPRFSELAEGSPTAPEDLENLGEGATGMLFETQALQGERADTIARMQSHIEKEDSDLKPSNGSFVPKEQMKEGNSSELERVTNWSESQGGEGRLEVMMREANNIEDQECADSESYVSADEDPENENQQEGATSADVEHDDLASPRQVGDKTTGLKGSPSTSLCRKHSSGSAKEDLEADVKALAPGGEGVGHGEARSEGALEGSAHGGWSSLRRPVNLSSDKVNEAAASNLCSTLSSFTTLLKRQPAPPPPAAGKRAVKVRALEAAQAARRDEERKAEQRRMRREAIERAKEEKDKEVEKDKEAAKKKMDAQKQSEGAVEFRDIPALESEALGNTHTSKGGGVLNKVKRAMEVKLKMEADKARKLEEERKRKEDEWRKKESELVGKKRQRDEVEKKEREEKRKRAEEVVKARKEEAEKQRAEIEEKERKRKAVEAADKERKAAEEEMKRQKRVEREREMERRRQEEEERKVLRAVEKEAERKRKEELFQKRKEWEEEEKRRNDEERRARLAEGSAAAASGAHASAIGSAAGSSQVPPLHPGAYATAVRVPTANPRTPSKGSGAFAFSVHPPAASQGASPLKRSSKGVPMGPPPPRLPATPGSARKGAAGAGVLGGALGGGVRTYLGNITNSINMANGSGKAAVGASKAVLDGTTATRSGTHAENTRTAVAGSISRRPGASSESSQGGEAPGSRGTSARISQAAAGTSLLIGTGVRGGSSGGTNAVVGTGGITIGPGGWIRGTGASARCGTGEGAAPEAFGSSERKEGAERQPDVAQSDGERPSGEPRREAYKCIPVIKVAAPVVPEGGPQSYEISPYKDSSDEEDEEDEEELDSDGEDKSKKPIPLWATKEFLIPHLQAQQHIDPDDIFRSVKTCSLEDVFASGGSKRRTKFRKRSSSGNWIQDRLTWQEQIAYKKALGYIP